VSVTVDGAPIRLPDLTGMPEPARTQMLKWCRDMTLRVTQLRARTGGSDDAVATSQAAAQSAQADTTAISSGASTATLTPANPLSYTTGNARTSVIQVAGHVRSGAAAPLIAADVSPEVDRDATYFIYYDDVASLGGAQTFLATLDNSILSVAGRRYIGSIYIPPSAYPDREISLS